MELLSKTINKIFKDLQKAANDNSGAATIEIVIIIAVLMAIALIFNSELRDFAKSLFAKVFDDQSVLNKIGTIGG